MFGNVDSGNGLSEMEFPVAWIACTEPMVSPSADAVNVTAIDSPGFSTDCDDGACRNCIVMTGIPRLGMAWWSIERLRPPASMLVTLPTAKCVTGVALCEGVEAVPAETHHLPSLAGVVPDEPAAARLCLRVADVVDPGVEAIALEDASNKAGLGEGRLGHCTAPPPKHAAWLRALASSAH